jgi:hypothetical protein
MATEHSAQVARLRDKLARLLDLCRDHAAFARQHRIFPPQPALDLTQLAQFEASHAVKLPEDYAEFLTGIANGCPGPAEGILPLECWAETVMVSATATAGPDYLAEPCPLHPDLPRDASWMKALGSPRYGPYQGAMAIGRRGGRRYTVLVVAGPHRGRVVHIDLELTAPRFAAQRKFLDWYEDWLDETLESAQYEAI